MIVQNEQNNIEKCIQSVSKYIDEIRIVDTGSTDDTMRILKALKKASKIPFEIIEINPKDNPEYWVEIEGRKRIKFAKARNLSFKDIKSDWTLWLDGDDILEGGQNLKSEIRRALIENVDAISCTYQYLIVEGKVRDSHPKERILKTGTHRWEFMEDLWLVHENTYAYDGKIEALWADSFIVIHQITSKEMADSSDRNVDLLKYMIQQPELENDPRVHFLLGRELFGRGNYDEAITYLMNYLNMEYTAHDGLQAAYDLALICEAKRDFKTGLEWGLQMMKIKPDHPLGFLTVAKFNLLIGNNREALAFIEDANRRPISPLDPFTQSPLTLKRTALMVASEAYERLGDFDRSIAAMQEWLKYADKAELKNLTQEIRRSYDKQQLQEIKKAFVVNANVELIRQSSQKGFKDFDFEPFLDMIDRVPQPIQASREVIGLKRRLGLESKRKDKTVTIVCTMNFEKWDPETVIAKGGGGSETAVVELAARFAKEGFNVEVYGNPTKEKTYGGVQYKNIFKLDLSDEFDIFICWRDVNIFKEGTIKARKKYLWLQDIMYAEDYTKDILDQLDKIIVLSKYHRETAMHVPESKFYYTTNGINTKLIEEVEKEIEAEGLKRETGYCIYASSSDRGLEGLVAMWPEIKKDLWETSMKECRLTWFYGWNSWNKLRAKNTDAAKWQDKMIKDMESAGIKEGGRVGKKELYKEFFKAQFLTYPLVGPAETSCIVMMEAQACGLIPITTGITALEETQQFGLKKPIKDYQFHLTQALSAEDGKSEEYRKKMAKWARETFNWDRVAKNWIKDLF